jgi:small redox-active disulfide protein 2
MLSIKVLGPGCSYCERLKAATKEALTMLGAEGMVEAVTDRAQFRAYRLVVTPGLVVNGKLVCAGRVPSASKVMALVANVLAEQDARS